MDKRKVILLSIYVFIFFLMEYLYLPFEGDETPVAIAFQDFTIRLDSYVYYFCMKGEQLIFALTLRLLLPIKEYTKWIVLTFALAVFEYPLTYNEPIAKLLLPDFWGFQPYVPASTATLKFASVCYFMYGAIKKAME
jgi:hypothetical protein